MPRRRQYRIGGGGQETTNPYDEQRRKNQIAADQYSNMVAQMRGGADTTGEESEPSRLALAHALGESTDTPLGPLMARFRSLPPNVQAGIYRQGGAQFIGGAEGSKLLSSLSSNKDKALDVQTANLGEMLASGKIQFDQDENGKPSFHILEKDPSDPAGLKQKKTPLNVYQLGLLKRGFEQGTLINPWNPTQTDTSINMPRPQTTDEFQQVLNQRAAGGSDVDEFQRILNARAVGREGVLGPKPMVASVPTGTEVAPASPSAIDPFLAVNKFIRSGGVGQAATNFIEGPFRRFVGDVGTAAVDTVTSGITNPLIRLGSNAVKLGTGIDVGNPQIPLLSQQPPDNPLMYVRDQEEKQAEARRLAAMQLPRVDSEFGY